MQNNASILDTRKLMTGKDGRLFVEIDGVNTFLAEVDSFVVNMNITNIDVQPVGSILSYAVGSGVSYTLAISEMVIRDDLIIEPLIKSIRDGKIPTYNFQGGAERWDGQEQRVVLRDCTPDGEFTILNLTPGEVIKRNQNYRINNIPEFIKALKYE